MGHDHHFLSRLDRFSDADTELALALYRDHHLVRSILGYIKFETDAERIAVSLKDPVRGPFIIVTRTGRFVTCLAEGMGARNLPVVSRDRFDAMTDHVHDLRRRYDALRLRTKDELRGLIERLLAGGSRVNREDIEILWLLRCFLLRKLLGSWREAVNHSIRIMKRMLRISMPHAKDMAWLRRLWAAYWYVGHFAALSGLDQPAGVPDALDVINGVRADFARWAVIIPALCTSWRGMWLAATMGEKAMELGERAWRTPAECPGDRVFAVTCIVAAAWRKPALLADARAILLQPPACGGDERVMGPAQWDGVREQFEQILDPERGYEAGAAHVRTMAFELLQECPRKHDLHFESPDDVPLDLAVPIAAQLPFGFPNLRALLEAFMALPVIAPLRAEQLYLPQELNEAIGRRYSETEARTIFNVVHYAYEKLEPQRVEPKPGVNAPCPCGSGRKYKRCCGSATKQAPESCAELLQVTEQEQQSEPVRQSLCESTA